MRSAVTLGALAALFSTTTGMAASLNELNRLDAPANNTRDPVKDVEIIKAAQEKRERKNQKRLKNG